MRAFFYPNEYKKCIQMWQEKAKTINPFKRAHAKNMVNFLENEMYGRHPELKGMNEKTQDVYLEQLTEREKEKLFNKLFSKA